MLLLLPLLALGAIALIASRHTQDPPALQLASQSTIAQGVPSPLVVLDGFLRAGLTPPPTVIMCALAEAEVMERHDMALAIVQTFIAPVVAAAEQNSIANARSANGSGSWPISPSPWPPEVPPPWQHDQGSPGTAPPWAMPSSGSNPSQGATTPGIVPGTDLRRASSPEDALREIAMAAAPRGEPPRTQAQGHPEESSEGTITVSGRSSPIEGVGTEEWGAFVGKISRELPTFTSARHVGQFRQRMDRLADLGLDPSQVATSPDAQRAALDADMADAHHHAAASGMLAHHCGAAVEIPIPGGAKRVQVTLSGVLGVIQAAGLEGAAEWLERPADRKRFPHTTQAFLRTNGVF